MRAARGATGNWVDHYDVDPTYSCIVMPLGSLTVGNEHVNVSFCDFTIVNLSGVASDAFYAFMAAPITGNIDALGESASVEALSK